MLYKYKEYLNRKMLLRIFLFRGYYNDKVLGNDVYYYYAVFTIGGKEEIRTGDVSVVR